jgi:SNF2 family DNA or RNA helicase
MNDELVLARKPILKPRPSGKFQMADFQRQDIDRLTEDDEFALWNEMGTFKTTTAEWAWERKLKHIANPRVLVITTKTGKGTYLESLPEVLPEWDTFVATSKGFQMVLNGKVVTRYNKKVELPNPLYFRPVIVLAHYHCFTNRACVPQPVKETYVDPMTGKESKRNKMHVNPVTGETDGTFEMTNPPMAELLQKHWDMIVIDEAHRIKNQDAQWTRNIKRLHAPHKIIMTGTGFVNNPAEMWSLLDFLFSGRKNSPHAEIVGGTGYWKFREYFCEEEVGYQGYRKIVGIKPDKVDEFRELRERVGVRRTMIECFPNIQEPIETVVEVDLSPAQRKMYDGIIKYLNTLDAQGVPLHSPTVLSALTRCRQIAVATPKVLKDEWVDKTGPSGEDLGRRVIEVELTEPSSKLDAAQEIIEGLQWDAERKDQVVVFSNFRQPLDLLKARLEKAGITYLHMTAEMNETQRYNLWHDKWWSGEYQVFLCTLGVGSESINLSCAHRAIFLDQDWSPAKNKQAIGRIYRPGQTGASQLIYIRARDTVDYRVLDAVNEKHSWFASIFGKHEDTDVEDEDE